MATTQSLNTSSVFDTQETHRLPGYGRLAALNGLFIGLAVCLAYWGPKAIQMRGLPVQFADSLTTSLLTTSLLIILLCTLVGWLTGLANKWWLTILSWAATAVSITLILGFLPARSINWLIWFNDALFRGLPVYPMPVWASWWSFLVAGILLIFVLILLSILQEIRLARAFNQLGRQGRMTGSALLALLWPAMFVGLAVTMMPDHLGNAPRQGMQFVHQGIETVRDYDGDLFALSKQTGFNYNALNGVRDQLAGPYTLMVGEVDPGGSLVTVVALFDSGVWIWCDLNADYVKVTYLSFCRDGSRPYTDGFHSLLTGQPLPEECTPHCMLQVNTAWRAWLQERADRLGETPRITRLAVQGGYVWMQAASADESFVIECLFSGMRQVQVQTCREAGE